MSPEQAYLFKLQGEPWELLDTDMIRNLLPEVRVIDAETSSHEAILTGQGWDDSGQEPIMMLSIEPDGRIIATHVGREFANAYLSEKQVHLCSDCFEPTPDWQIRMGECAECLMSK
jgi:hypothetical protein